MTFHWWQRPSRRDSAFDRMSPLDRAAVLAKTHWQTRWKRRSATALIVVCLSVVLAMLFHDLVLASGEQTTRSNYLFAFAALPALLKQGLDRSIEATRKRLVREFSQRGLRSEIESLLSRA